MTDDRPASTGTGAAERPEDPGPTTVSDEQDVGVDTGRLRRLAARSLHALAMPAEAELSILLVDAPRMADLNAQALGERAVTDVVSFPLDDPRDPMPGTMLLGDIVLCPAYAQRQARALGRSLDDECAQLLVHGLLHLLGRDHADPRSEHAMAAEERALLAAVGELAT